MKILKVFIFLAITAAFLFSENNIPVVTRLKFISDNLPRSFNKYRIVHLSDLHNKQYGRNNWILILLIKSVKPDLIVITGDMINAENYDEGSILSFMDGLVKIAPVYFVTGNHEIANINFPHLEQKLRKNAVKVLRNSCDMIKKDGDAVLLMGIDDPITTSMDEKGFIYEYLTNELETVLAKSDKNMFKILLAHRPEQFPLYAGHKIDLIFSGHAHGGQIRLPFVGGLYAPGQGFFPKYTSGMYTNGNSTMVVSRGLGNSSFQQRIFNHPEIIVITLYNSRR